MKHTTKHITLILIGSLFFQNIIAQDTLLLDSRSGYDKDSDTVGILQYFGKSIYYKAEYSRELIQFTKDSAKLEYCFYYNKKRYKLDNRTYLFTRNEDSLVTVTYNSYEEKWRYEYLTDSLYKLSRITDNLIEIGFAKCLIPFEKIGDFYVFNIKGDTLGSIKYSDIVFPDLYIKEKPIDDSVFVFCDSMPTYPGGLDKMLQDLLKNLRIDMPIIESSLNCTRIVISFVIDKHGEMRDIRFLRTCDNGFIERAILVALTNLEKFTNGFMDNKPVNIRFTLPIYINLQ